jgi:hypothetical protein
LTATLSNRMPDGVSGFSGVAVLEEVVAAGFSSELQAASADPAPTARTATPPTRSAERRDMDCTMSPKYSLPLVLGAGLEHASPHRLRQVMCWRDDRPWCATKRFNGKSAMAAGSFHPGHRRGLDAGFGAKVREPG